MAEIKPTRMASEITKLVMQDIFPLTAVTESRLLLFTQQVDDIIDEYRPPEDKVVGKLVEALGDIEVLTRPGDAEKKGIGIFREELLNDIGRLARAALTEYEKEKRSG